MRIEICEFTENNIFLTSAMQICMDYCILNKEVVDMGFGGKVGGGVFDGPSDGWHLFEIKEAKNAEWEGKLKCDKNGNPGFDVVVSVADDDDEVGLRHRERLYMNPMGKRMLANILTNCGGDYEKRVEEACPGVKDISDNAVLETLLEILPGAFFKGKIVTKNGYPHITECNLANANTGKKPAGAAYPSNGWDDNEDLPF